MSVRPGLYQVITFARALDQGNPAFVLTDPGEVSDHRLSALCATLGVGVLAVVDRPGATDPLLRFFTAEGSHPGAGHSSLAAAHVAFMQRSDEQDRIVFRLLDGAARVAYRHESRIGVNFPVMEASQSTAARSSARRSAHKPLEAFALAFG